MRLLGRQVDAQAHASRDGALEVNQPLQLVRDEEVAVLWVDGLRRVGGGIRSHDQGQRDDAADRFEGLDATRIA